MLSGPFGAVKEQVSGLYAQTLAERGFVTLAFDPSFTGESGGAVRNVASPEFFTEDFSAAVDYVGLLPNVDRERVGAIGICGLSGMALTAASGDSRIKAVATASMYDMSRSMSRSYKDSYTREQRHKVIDYLSQQRWADAEKGTYALGYHEVPFDANGQIVKEPACCRSGCRRMRTRCWPRSSTTTARPAATMPGPSTRPRVDRHDADVVLRVPDGREHRHDRASPDHARCTARTPTRSITRRTCTRPLPIQRNW